jgi:pyruvate formate-lyase/glycerol dehydratase family glycyl radical enzyme
MVNKKEIEEIEKVNALTDRVKRLEARYKAANPHLCCVRAQLVTESHKETDGQPLDIRRAKMFKRVMEKLPIAIREDELIVGCQTGHAIRGASPVVDFDPEYTFQIFNSSKITLNSGQDSAREEAGVDEEEKRILLECATYWSGKSPADFIRKAQRDAYGSKMDDMVAARLHFGIDQRPMTSRYVDHEKVIYKGLKSVIAETEEALRKIYESDFMDPEAVDKINFLQSVVISLEGAIIFAKRYSTLAKELAAKETNAARKKELEKIAGVCEWVPENPARNFHEAVQCLWFTHLCCNLEHSYNNEAPGRMDQTLNPAYEKDLKAGKITRQDAAELMGCLWVKFGEMEVAKGAVNREHIQGNMGIDIIIGGVRRDGSDATSEMTYLILETSRRVKTVQPLLYFRSHRGTPDELWMKVIEVCKDRTDGQPAILNDETVINNFTAKGIPLEDARDFLVGGCIHPCTRTGSPDRVMHPNISKVFEMMLYNGFDPKTKKQIGPKTGDPRTFKSFEELYNAFKVQTEYIIDFFGKCYRLFFQVRNQHYSFPYSSALMDGCIEKGKDQMRGGCKFLQLNWGMQDRGNQNPIDSLAAIKKVVFEEKKATMAEVLDAVANNFEGKEALRQMLKAAPKYGNDDDYVDSIFDDWSLWTQRRIAQEKTVLGYPMRSGRGGATVHFAFGKVCGALPDGRKAGEPLADGSLSPMRGCDLKGPTALLNSASRINHCELSTDTLINLKFPPAVIATLENRKKLKAMIRTYFDRGGYQVQFNLMGQDILKEAQQKPGEHKDLMVRVAGYSAYFVDLSPAVQEDIIARTEHTL